MVTAHGYILGSVTLKCECEISDNNRKNVEIKLVLTSSCLALSRVILFSVSISAPTAQK